MLYNCWNQCRMSAETSMTDEVKTVVDKIPSWAQILITKLHSIKSHTEENMQNMKACTDLLYTFVMNWDNLTSTTSAVATLSFFSRISQLYKQFHSKAAHCNNECELTLKAASLWLTQIWRKKSEIQTLTTTNCC